MLPQPATAHGTSKQSKKQMAWCIYIYIYIYLYIYISIYIYIYIYIYINPGRSAICNEGQALARQAAYAHQRGISKRPMRWPIKSIGCPMCCTTDAYTCCCLSCCRRGGGAGAEGATYGRGHHQSSYQHLGYPPIATCIVPHMCQP